MSMAPAEERALAHIEARLRWSDPRLAVKLVLFGHRRGRGPVTEALSPWRGRRRQAIRVAFVTTVAATMLTGAGFAISNARPGTAYNIACHAKSSASSRWWPGSCTPASCPAGQRAAEYPLPLAAAIQSRCRPAIRPADVTDHR